MDTALPSISVASLASTLGSPDAPLVLDVRRAPAYDADDRTLPGALRAPPDAIDARGAALSPERSVVAFCVHGHEVSQGTVRRLRERGVDARFLEGGIAAWRAASLPLVRRLPELGIPAAHGTPSAWITRERPKIDRIACPWLVRRFVDPGARFLYVPAGEVERAARDSGAIPYDVPGVRFSHRGEACSFDAFLAEFGLADPTLAALADIVRAADTGHPERSPQAPGLLAVSLGLAALHADDLRMLEQGVGVYDALYAWLRSARGERNVAVQFGQG